jgi:hypothetical protein
MHRCGQCCNETADFECKGTTKGAATTAKDHPVPGIGDGPFPESFIVLFFVKHFVCPNPRPRNLEHLTIFILVRPRNGGLGAECGSLLV